MLLGTGRNSYDGPNNEAYDLLQIVAFSKLDYKYQHSPTSKLMLYLKEIMLH
jgi:hypothetical protein